MKITVTRKVFLIIATLIAFMSGAFFTLAHNDLEGMFRTYASEARHRTAVQWADVISYFYQTENHSWVNVTDSLTKMMSQNRAQHDLPQQLIVLDGQNHIIVQAGVQTGMRDRSMYTTVPIMEGDRQIGTLLIYGEGLDPLYEIEETVIHTMTLATMWGIIIASALALLSGALMARRMTRPLKFILKAIKQITRGELDTQIPVTSTDEFGQVARAFNEMTRQLAATEEARKHLVADVAHELRIPLTIMQGQLELIQQGVRGPKPEDLLPIHDEVIRLSRLVQDLHQLSQAEVGKLQLRKQPTDIVHFLQRLLENFEVEAMDKKIKLELQTIDEQLPMLKVDPDRLTQVFVNLLGNALRYTPDEGTVRVEVTRSGDFVEVALSDTGPGIDPNHVPFIFNRFYRGDEDRSRGTGGTGLGLAIAKEFVEAHQGKIEVTSELGMGTTFVVSLPIN
ncbi:sensor histidine kinase [Alicyclobacillus dauci]|uniref:Signal transduction histidine-protein kinase/phosphatase MprB n=1 Tax=Alicyclobacillus dauci TaxID=1475485 RepID=A0ABY6YYU0_9BACL|nr:ATP-binding protein [Alicyclobacillus dauci]WAH35249.1 ATP-binding protein [Alicyclobacillus dauci]